MRATMILCDAAQESGGKLYIIGGGWTNLNTPNAPANMALGILLHVDWNETNKQLPVEIELRTVDGEVVEVPEGNPVRVATALEVGRPVGVKPGTELTTAMASSFNGIVLPEGGFVWILRTGEQVLERVPFTVGSARR